MAEPVLVDLRNIYPPSQAEEAGFRYVSVGRPGQPDDAEASNERQAA